jgi:hypothetical protein
VKDFDDKATQNHTFKVAGETFKWHNVRPEILFDLGEALGKEGAPTGADALDAQVIIFLPEEEKDHWKTLREREENPVTVKQLNEIVEWLVSEQTGRPTVTPSPSAPGPGRTAASSKAA